MEAETVMVLGWFLAVAVVIVIGLRRARKGGFSRDTEESSFSSWSSSSGRDDSRPDPDFSGGGGESGGGGASGSWDGDSGNSGDGGGSDSGGSSSD